jgi:hypothetical protein
MGIARRDQHPALGIGEKRAEGVVAGAAGVIGKADALLQEALVIGHVGLRGMLHLQKH